jgi:hypothetical protein
MKAMTSIVPQNHLLRILIATVILLLIPLAAMQFNEEVNWRFNDFVVAGVLLFAAGLAYDLIVRKVQRGNRKIIATVLVAVAFLYIWAELAVGIFTNLGS